MKDKMIKLGGVGHMVMIRLVLLMTAILLIFSINQRVDASTASTLDKHEVQELLKQAFEAQYSLTEQHYSWEEAKTKLSTYMTDELANGLMDEHLFLEEQGYIFYGTDFSTYIVPRFSFNDDTIIVSNTDMETVFVYEQFEGTGPVIFDSQYEVVTLKLNKAEWKIADISFVSELPKKIHEGKSLEEIKEEQSLRYSITKKKNANYFRTETLQTTFNVNPVSISFKDNSYQQVPGQKKPKIITLLYHMDCSSKTLIELLNKIIQLIHV